MRLLILTQKMDKNDDLLGFMHDWAMKFSERFESMIVLALGVGEHALPDNIKVFSLGKEQYGDYSGIIRKLVSVCRFYKYIFRHKNEYDCVLVHMNKEYMLLGGLFWRFLGKKTALWYNHGAGNIFSILAGFLAQKIFCTSPFSFFAKWPKVLLMPAGINTDIFKKDERIRPIKNSILFLGRISPIKGVHFLIEAAILLDKNNVDFILNIVGQAGEKDGEYFKKIKNLAGDLEQKGKIKFWGKVANYKTAEVYNQNEISVNLTDSGSFDKAILEAMACEKLVLVFNESFKNILPAVLFFQEKNTDDIAKKLEQILILPKESHAIYGRELRAYVLQNHSLDKLTERISILFQN